MNRLLGSLAAVTLCVSPLVAQGDGSGRDGPRTDIDLLASYLSLSPEQVEELQILQNRFHEEIQGINQQIKENRQAVKAELQSAVPDANLIGQLMIEIKELQDSKKGVKASYNEPALAVLNDEQVRLLNSLKLALRLFRTAKQAVFFNLIVGGNSDEPDDSIL